MNIICNNIIMNISEYSHSKEIKNIILSQKKFDFLLLNYYKTLKKEIIIQKFNFHIINLFGDIHKFTKFKILPWKPQYIGFTDYIDSIPKEDLEENKIMIGIDQYERPFVAINNDDRVKILFQRYTNLNSTWACANFEDFYGHFFVNNEFRIQTHKITKLLSSSNFTEFAQS